MERPQSNRHLLGPCSDGICKLGIYANNGTSNLFHGCKPKHNHHITNRIKPARVWLDEEGYICAEVGKKNEMPTSGQFVAMWEFDNQIWSRTLKWVDDVLMFLDIKTNEFVEDSSWPKFDPEDNVNPIYHVIDHE